jgi:hypothetical protein
MSPAIVQYKEIVVAVFTENPIAGVCPAVKSANISSLTV